MTDTEKLHIALQMLAYWVCCVENNGTQWDDWDEAYKDAAYRDTPIREELSEYIEVMKKQWAEDL